MWARKAAEAGLVKAMYAIGYFLEVGIGTEPSMQQCVILILRFAPPSSPFLPSDRPRSLFLSRLLVDCGMSCAATSDIIGPGPIH